MKPFKISFTGIVLPILFFSVAVNAQKPPAKQQNSLPAPANIKVDGKLTEWDNKLQAYNDGSRVFYTFSNDANNLYLAIKMDSQEGTEKALKSGIGFSILSPNDRSKKVEVTYHASAYKDEFDALEFLPKKFKDRVKESNKFKMDSLVRVGNELISRFHKNVLIKGIKEIKDPIIPIYNEYGIVVAARLNDNMEYVYELALPLKLISGFIAPTNVIKYNISVNWISQVKNPGQFDPPRIRPDNAADFTTMYRNNDTGFSGEFTLTK